MKKIRNVLEANQEIERLVSLLNQHGIDSTNGVNIKQSAKASQVSLAEPTNQAEAIAQFIRLKGNEAAQFYKQHSSLLKNGKTTLTKKDK